MASTGKLAICTANFVARESAYALHPFQWGAADQATRESFHATPERFAEKFDELVALCQQLGFQHLDLWVAHLDPWISCTAMEEEAVAILQRRGVGVVSYSAGFGKAEASRALAERSLRVAQRLGAPRYGVGLHPSNEALAVELCREYGMRYGIENHPEKSAEAMRERLEAIPGNFQDGRPGIVGVAFDTGWWATQDVDPVEAIHILKDHILHVHLKDVQHHGLPHETCALGDGVVDVPGVLAALQAIGYDGYLAVEHEPEYHDPCEELRQSVARLESWLAAL